MATRTSVGSGLWSAVGTWDTGVPADGDTFVIAAGHTVTFDADQTAWVTGLAGSNQIRGTLQVSTSPGAYAMKVASQISMVGGTFRVGTSTSVPYPATCSFVCYSLVAGGGNVFSLDANSRLYIYCVEPAIKYCRLTSTAALGATVLNVDTDCRGVWADGHEITINDVVTPLPDTEDRVIAAGGVGANAITITVGLTSQKTAGSWIVLCSRNVRFTCHAPATTVTCFNTPTLCEVHAEIRNFAKGLATATNCSIGGCVWGGTTGLSARYVAQPAYCCTFSGVSSGIWGVVSSGLANVLLGSCVIIGGTRLIGGICTLQSGVLLASAETLICCSGFVGAVTACDAQYAASNGASNLVIDGAVLERTFGAAAIYSCTNVVVKNVIMRSNTRSTGGIGNGRFVGCQMLDASEAANYQNVSYPTWNIYESLDHDGVAGAFIGWCQGGVVSSVVDVVPPGYTHSRKHALAALVAAGQVDGPCWYREVMQIPPGYTLRARAWLRKDASQSYLPRVQIVERGYDAVGAPTPLASAQMTNSIDTWEVVGVQYTNSGALPLEVEMQVVAWGTSGNAWSTLEYGLGNLAGSWCSWG